MTVLAMIATLRAEKGVGAQLPPRGTSNRIGLGDGHGGHAVTTSCRMSCWLPTGSAASATVHHHRVAAGGGRGGEC